MKPSFRQSHFPRALFEAYRRLLSETPCPHELPWQDANFVARLDYFLSVKSVASGVALRKLIQRHFDGVSRKYLEFLRQNGFLGQFGHTVDLSQHLLNFPNAGRTLLWIPKNASTAVKRLMIGGESPERRERIRPPRFHETCQAEFGLSRAELAQGKTLPMVAVVRDPYERIVSCYVNKFAVPAMKGTEFEKFIPGHVKRAFGVLGIPERPAIESLSFAEFASYIAADAPYSWDFHWRPQYCFLHGLEEMVQLIPLERLDVLARLVGHSDVAQANRSTGLRLDHDRPLSGECAELMPAQLRDSKLQSYNQFFNPTIMRQLAIIYGPDKTIHSHALRTATERADNGSGAEKPPRLGCP